MRSVVVFAMLVVALAIPSASVTVAARAECAGRTCHAGGHRGQRHTIRGTAGADVIAAKGGRDRILGRGGRDVICGGAGPDRIEGGGGRDLQAGRTHARGGRSMHPVPSRTKEGSEPGRFDVPDASIATGGVGLSQRVTRTDACFVRLVAGGMPRRPDFRSRPSL
jgi:hypothetical protein